MASPSKFVITGLPRTRGAWFAAYFTQGKTLCYHEATLNNSDMDVEGYDHVGNADSGYIICPEWQDALGDHKVVVIHRNAGSVAEALDALPYEFGEQEWALKMAARRLRAIEGLHIEFGEINPRLEEIHEYLGIPGYDAERAHLFFNLNIQSLDWSK